MLTGLNYELYWGQGVQLLIITLRLINKEGGAELFLVLSWWAGCKEMTLDVTKAWDVNVEGDVLSVHRSNLTAAAEMLCHGNWFY